MDDLVKRREELLVKLRAKKVELKEKAKEKKLLEEIKVLEKALKNPNTLDKINFALKNGKLKDKSKGFIEKASSFYEKIADFADKMPDAEEVITGTTTKKSKKKVKTKGDKK